jgi:predicted transcriptional regulator YheO
MNIDSYIPLCQAIVTLLDPLVETVIHDLMTDRIVFIAGRLSNRQVGDPSLLELTVPYENLEQQIDQIIYPKLSADGRLIKSISVPLQESREIKALLCINCDVSLFSQLQNLASSLLGRGQRTQPEILFKKDWQEKLHWVLHEKIKEYDWNFSQLTSGQKKNLVQHLFKIGAFEEKKAADYIADILNMGRATIFNYLKELRKNDN